MDHQTFAQILGSYGEFVGALAVVVTLAYLARQIGAQNAAMRQTASIERTAGQRELLARCRDWVELTIAHPELIGVLRKALSNWDSATPDEKERASSWMLSAALQAEQALYMWREQLINEQSYQGFMGAVAAIVATPGGRKWWVHARIVLGDDISNQIDQELASRPEGSPDWIQMFPHLQPEAEWSR